MPRLPAAVADYSLYLAAKPTGRSIEGDTEGAAMDDDAEAVAAAPGGGVLAIVPKAKGGVGALRKKILEKLGDKPVEEGMYEAKGGFQIADVQVQEMAAFEEAQSRQADEALKEFEDAKAKVAAAIDAEAASAEKYREMQEKRKEANAKVNNKRRELLEEQKKLAMLEVVAVNAAKVKLLEEKRKAAAEAAEQAKRNLMEQRQNQKDAFEAARRQLEEARRGMASAKGAGEVGLKRPAPNGAVEPPGKRAADETDTVP